MTADDLEARVRVLEDRFALQDLVHRYGVAMDERDLDAVAAMFADDAVFVHPAGTATGGREITEAYRGRLKNYTTTYHYAHTQGVTFTGPVSADGLVTGHAELSIDGRSYLVALRYHDRYVRTDAGWLFLERRQRFTYVLPFDELPTGLGDELRLRWPGTEPAPAHLPDASASYAAFLSTL